MGQADILGPVIVMVEADGREDIYKWFEDSRFNVFDAISIFDALEAVSDFTVRDQPDVVLLDVERCDRDMPLIRSAYQALTDQLPPEVMGVSKETAAVGAYYQGNLANVAARLDRMIPNRMTSQI